MSSELDREDIPDMVYVDNSDTPLDLRPDLTIYGIEEVDRGVCEDSYENRSILRVSKLGWQIIYTDTGEPTGNIRVLSPEMSRARSVSSAEDRKIILTDPRDLNSDYLTEESLLIEEQSDSLVPLWVIAATRTWIRVRESRTVEGASRRYPQYETPPGRCRRIKADGVRCLMWTTGRKTDDGLCRIHLGGKGNTTTGAVARARERVYQSAPRAIEILEELMDNAESEPVKLKAATEILARAGVRGGFEIEGKLDLEVRPAAELIMERLNRLQPDIITIIPKELETAPEEPDNPELNLVKEPSNEKETSPLTAAEPDGGERKPSTRKK